MKSIDRLKDFLAADPANVELRCELVDNLFEQGSFDEARAVVDSAPDSARAASGMRFRIARLQLVFGQYAETEALLSQLLTEHPGNPALIHDIAFAQLCQRRLDAARHTLSLLPAESMTDAEIGVLAARVAMMDGAFDETQKILSRVLEDHPDHATALGLSALAWLDDGNDDEAQRCAADCLARHPEQHEALLAAGALALSQRDAERADDFFARALRRFPNSGRALSGMAQVQMLRGDLPTAHQTLNHAVVAMPDHIGTWHALAWVQLLQGDLEAAGRSYQTAYDLDRNFAESHGGLAIVALLSGRMEEGEASMKRALKLDPNCASGRYARTLWLSAKGEDDASNALFASLFDEGVMPGVSASQAAQMAEALKTLARSRRQND